MQGVSNHWPTDSTTGFFYCFYFTWNSTNSTFIWNVPWECVSRRRGVPFNNTSVFWVVFKTPGVAWAKLGTCVWARWLPGRGTHLCVVAGGPGGCPGNSYVHRPASSHRTQPYDSGSPPWRVACLSALSVLLFTCCLSGRVVTKDLVCGCWDLSCRKWRFNRSIVIDFFLSWRMFVCVFVFYECVNVCFVFPCCLAL